MCVGVTFLGLQCVQGCMISSHWQQLVHKYYVTKSECLFAKRGGCHHSRWWRYSRWGFNATTLLDTKSTHTSIINAVNGHQPTLHAHNIYEKWAWLPPNFPAHLHV